MRVPGLRRRAGANGSVDVDRQIELPIVVPAYAGVARRRWGWRRVLAVLGVAGVVAVVLAAAGYAVLNTLALESAKRRLTADNAQLQAQLSELRSANSNLGAENDVLQRNNDLAALRCPGPAWAAGQPDADDLDNLRRAVHHAGRELLPGGRRAGYL